MPSATAATASRHSTTPSTASATPAAAAPATSSSSTRFSTRALSQVALKKRMKGDVSSFAELERGVISVILNTQGNKLLYCPSKDIPSWGGGRQWDFFIFLFPHLTEGQADETILRD